MENELKRLKVEKMKRIEELEEIILELEYWNPGEKIKDEITGLIGNISNREERDLRIQFLKENIELMKERKPDDNKLYLTEIIEAEKPEFGSNNLILAPVGSGKTTLIESVLLKEQVGKILMLVSNTTLKNSVCSEDIEIRKRKGNRMFTSANKERFGDKDYDVHVMTYSEFGNKISLNNDFVKDVNQIYCDEIHSLPEYEEYGKNKGLIHAIKYLFDKQDEQIFYFTATRENLDNLEKQNPGTLKNIKTFDYLDHPEIKQYMTLSEYKINQIEQIRPHLKARLKSFNYFGYKCLAFNRTISGQKKIEEIAIEEGFKPLVIWSINNKDKSLQMNEEQLNGRKYLIENGIIPEPYNFLIINSAMQEGWNLYDEKVKLAIMNTTNKTEKIQALGRYRNDLDVLVYRVNRENNADVIIDLPKHYLNTPLDVNLKEELCYELNVINTAGKVSKWRAIKKLLQKQGYLIEEGTKTFEGKRRRVSTISK